MIVYVIAAAQALGYLAAVPLYLALRLRVDDGVRLGVGVGAFERRFALKKAAARPKKRRRRHGAGLGLRCLRRAGVEQIRLRGRLCLGDAALTAVACGAARALAGGLCAAGDARVDIAPDFDSAAPRVELQGVARVRAGRVIAAAARCGIDSIRRRIAP